MTNMLEMTNSALVEIHNALNKDKQLKNWKSKKTDLIAIIEALQAKEAAEKAAAEAEKSKPKNPNRGKIKQMTLDLLTQVVSKNEDGRPVGLSYNEIMDLILAEVPTAKPSVKSLAWYASKLNSEGTMLPIRPRSKTVKEEVAAVETTTTSEDDDEDGFVIKAAE